jgi:hypothetical protein
MENNQEHKIDKIFRETFENQLFTPPTDAWMGIHTYTIGQEESKKKIWLRYASLALLFLLVSGLGIWYFVDNQVIKLANNSSISPVAGLPTSPLVHKHTQKSILPTTAIAVVSVSPFPIVHEHTQKLHTPEVDWSGDKPRGEEVVSGDTDHGGTLLSHELLVENTNNGENQYNIEEIDSKPLFLNDLTDKMQKESERKIVALEEKLDYKKEVYKPDSVVYGKKFSLKHPIINFRLGLFTNFVNINTNNEGENPFFNNSISSNNISLASSTFGIAWKVNDRSRVSVNFNYCTYSPINLPSKEAAAYIDPLSSNNKPTGTFKYDALKGVHEYLTPFGSVTLPIDPKFSITPKDFYAHLFGSLTVWQIGMNYEHDFISLKSKKGIPALQMYGLAGINFQGASKYRYSFYKFRNFDPAIDTFYVIYPNAVLYTEKSLGNSSPIVLGYSAGVGTRFQLSKRFGMNFSINYEGDITSWVKNLSFSTRLSVLSAQSGFFVNL